MWQMWMTHSFVRLDSFVRVTWPILTCDMAHPRMTHIRGAHAAKRRDLCDITHSYVWHDSLACSWLSEYHTYTAPMLRSGEIWAALVLKLPDNGRFATVGIAFEGDQVLMCNYIPKYGQTIWAVLGLPHGHGFTSVCICMQIYTRIYVHILNQYT